MREMMDWLVAEEDGQGMVEYALILALVAIVVITALTGVGTKIKTIFENISSKL